MRKTLKVAAALIAASALAACGGGGADAGTSPFASGSAASSPSGAGTVGPAPGGGISVVSNGVPSQKYMSIAVETYNLDWSFDGKTTTISVRVADSAGNPVPQGTVVQFSTEGGQIQKSCQLSGSTSAGLTLSTCSVTFGTQELRPLDRLVGIVAWMEGEEAYADTNGNGQYDAGEPFYDSGKIFRDDDHDGAYTANVDEINVGGTVGTPQLGTGTANCTANQPTNLLNDRPLSVTSTCDGVWGKTLVRANVTLSVSDPRTIDAVVDGNSLLVYSTEFSATPTQFVAAPAGTTVAVVSVPTGCVASISPASVPNTAVGPTRHTVSAIGTCGGAIGVKVAFGTVFEKVVLVPISP